MTGLSGDFYVALSIPRHTRGEHIISGSPIPIHMIDMIGTIEDDGRRMIQWSRWNYVHDHSRKEKDYGKENEPDRSL
jgi:hypothetical protein